MPRVDGMPELGRNRIHVSEVDAWTRHDEPLLTLPVGEPSREERAIAHHVAECIEDGASLQFGIGNVPNEIAKILASGNRGGFGVHTEMINDGIMHLHNAGKIENNKSIYKGFSVATFALGSQDLYQWIDNNPELRMLPVGAVNDPAITRQLHRLRQCQCSPLNRPHGTSCCRPHQWSAILWGRRASRLRRRCG